MTQSPFIEGTNFEWAWDSTALGMLKTCPRLYYYQMILGYRPRSASFHLDFGIWIHSALETYEKTKATGVGHEAALEAAVQGALIDSWDDTTDAPWDSGDSNKNRYTLIRSIIWHLEEFGDNDPCKTVILANGEAAVELSFSLEIEKLAPNGLPYVLSGHLDRIVEYSGETYVMDTKTTKSTLSGDYFKMYNPENQMSLYVIAADVQYQTPVRGVILNAMQILVGETRFARPITTRTKAQSEEWLRSLDVYLDQAVSYAEAGFWPMDDRACRGCSFRTVCAHDPSVRQTILDTQYVVKPWNPVAVR